MLLASQGQQAFIVFRDQRDEEETPTRASLCTAQASTAAAVGPECSYRNLDAGIINQGASRGLG